MRIDLARSNHRPRPVALVLAVVSRVMGLELGPPLALTYRPDLFDSTMNGYILRGVAYSGPWSKGESELFAAFVSNLNTCHF